MHGVNRDCPGRRQPKYRVHALFDEVDVMASSVEITVPQLSRLLGLPGAPALIDVRRSEEIKTASGHLQKHLPEDSVRASKDYDI
jgi:hypothetical protein